jgi:hypothetical protein
MRTGKPSPTAPLYSSRRAVSTSGANGRIRSKTRRFQSHRSESNSDTSPTQRFDPGNLGEKGGSLCMHQSLRASEPEDQILRIRPASIRPYPQGDCWNTITSREDQGSQSQQELMVNESCEQRAEKEDRSLRSGRRRPSAAEGEGSCRASGGRGPSVDAEIPAKEPP